MIVGIGTDVCSIDRIAAAHQRHGDRFAQRVLGPDEWRVFDARRARVLRRGLSYLATRFAAKEAVSKAFGTGIVAQLGRQDMEVCRKYRGEPYVVLHGNGKKLLEERNARVVLLSLSHTQAHAAAVAVLESH